MDIGDGCWDDTDFALRQEEEFTFERFSHTGNKGMRMWEDKRKKND